MKQRSAPLSAINPNLLLIGAGLIAVYWLMTRKADMTIQSPTGESSWYAPVQVGQTLQQGVTSAMVNQDKCNAAIAAGDVGTMLFNCPTFNSDWPSGLINWWNK